LHPPLFHAPNKFFFPQTEMNICTGVIFFQKGSIMKIKFLTYAVAISAALVGCGSGTNSDSETGGSTSLSYKIDGVSYTDPVKGISVASGKNTVIEASGPITTNMQDIQTSGNCLGSGGNPSQSVYSFSYTGPCGRKIIIGTAKGSFQLDVTIEAPASSGGGTPTPTPTPNCPHGSTNGICWGELVSPTPVQVVNGVNQCEYKPSPGELAQNPSTRNRLHPCPGS
jgi:hypothetical protein